MLLWIWHYLQDTTFREIKFSMQYAQQNLITIGKCTSNGMIIKIIFWHESREFHSLLKLPFECKYTHSGVQKEVVFSMHICSFCHSTTVRIFYKNFCYFQICQGAYYRHFPLKPQMTTIKKTQMTHLINPETDYEALTLSNKYLTELKKLISCIGNTLSRLKM